MKTKMAIKPMRWNAYSIAIAALIVTTLSCGQSLMLHDGGGMEVHARRLELFSDGVAVSGGELITMAGRSLSPLNARTFPAFATNARLEWETSDPAVAEVDDEGKLKIVATPQAGQPPVSTIIRASFTHDPSLYAETTVTVYPPYPRARRWNFTTHPTGGASGAAITGDIDLGQGGFLLQETGSASGYEDGNRGPGRYVIDPEDPYEFGVRPNGSARSGMNWQSGAAGETPEFYRESAAPADPSISAGHIRTGGNSRFMRIPVLEGPFTVIVNYRANGGNGDHADIRIGDRSGIRIEGEASLGNGPGQGKSVWYTHEGTDFVPVVYIETKGGAQIFDVYVLDRALYQYISVPTAYTVGGPNEILVGGTATYTPEVSPILTNPVYQWAISDESVARIRGASNGRSVSLEALSSGTVTLTSTITTTNPNNGATNIGRVTRTITVTGYTPVQSVSISGPSEVAVGGNITLTAAVTPTDASRPQYLWEIISGTGNLTIGAGNQANVQVTGASTGSATVRVTATTTNPNNPGQSNSVRTEHTVRVNEAPTGPPPGTYYYEWAAGGVFPFANGATHVVNGITWRRWAGNTFNITATGMTLNNTRFVIGSGSDVTSTATNHAFLNGELDLSKRATLFIDYTGLSGSNFQVYLNNNTTSNAVGGTPLGTTANRIFHGGTTGTGTQISASGTLELVINPAGFSNHASLSTAYLQIRAESGATITITGIRIRYD